ncbi:DUF3144 domain-containing protein [Gilvimarinus algae]|uniref:DUF3144 domain-containing protein n=1 Tax=Gilvimarinus algae TaxID=3058037 RepID=A0ABT8TBD6_9GAMM|nr:DUF3144 domain-containing protein [Gilvimarinus sp. SDUM040014]MDO3381422.1 DUF3144 domain-containing protein [Gilvimarinus sp. SDUM040014]
MTDKDDNDLYWDLVDEFIERANSRCETADPGMVSAALLQAAARFNAFVVASSSVDRSEFTEEIEPSLRYLTNQYRDFLKEHLEDYRENYKVYMRTEES